MFKCHRVVSKCYSLLNKCVAEAEDFVDMHAYWQKINKFSILYTYKFSVYLFYKNIPDVSNS